MSILDLAKADIEHITGSADDAGVELTFTAPAPGNESIVINGIHSKHHMAYDNDGKPVNSRNAHVSFAESLMVGYPVRDGSGEVNLKDHRVSVKDSTGVAKTYVIREWFPDETVGLITCILGDYQ